MVDSGTGPEGEGGGGACAPSSPPPLPSFPPTTRGAECPSWAVGGDAGAAAEGQSASCSSVSPRGPSMRDSQPASPSATTSSRTSSSVTPDAAGHTDSRTIVGSAGPSPAASTCWCHSPSAVNRVRSGSARSRGSVNSRDGPLDDADGGVAGASGLDSVTIHQSSEDQVAHGFVHAWLVDEALGPPAAVGQEAERLLGVRERGPGDLGVRAQHRQHSPLDDVLGVALQDQHPSARVRQALEPVPLPRAPDLDHVERVPHHDVGHRPGRDRELLPTPRPPGGQCLGRHDPTSPPRAPARAVPFASSRSTSAWQGWSSGHQHMSVLPASAVRMSSADGARPRSTRSR